MATENQFRDLTKMIRVTHQQSRLEFFKKQLKTATRSMNYHVERKHHHDICAEKGEIVSFYEWAVEMAEKEVAKDGN